MPSAAIYGPADRKHGGWIDHAMPYCALIAGICHATKTRRAIEIGTHYGGSTLSLLAGMRSGSLGAHDLRIATIDPERMNVQGLSAHPEIHRIDEAMPSDHAVRATKVALRNDDVDLIFVDALKAHEFVEYCSSSPGGLRHGYSCSTTFASTLPCAECGRHS